MAYKKHNFTPGHILKASEMNEIEAGIEDVEKKIPSPVVTSINGQTGAVNLSAADVNALPSSTTIPAATSDLTNDSGFITKAAADLVNYYLKSETYTRDEINQRISAIPKFTISVVSALPATGDDRTIYLVGGGVSGDLYTEYIWANGAWEILGSQRVDLTGYATETWVTGRLGSYLKASELEGAINTALAQAAASGEFDGVGIEGVTVTRSPDEFGYYYITVTLTDGQQQAIPYKNGEDGVSPVASVQQTSDGAIVTVVDKNGTTTATLKNGKDGEDGQRGTGILNITSGLTSYTTTINGLKPAYRILLSEAISQSQVSEILVGDSFRYSNYIYPVIAVDDTYAYCSTRVTIKGGDGKSVTHSWNGTVLTVTSSSGTSSADLQGPGGSDATVTTANITNALGYTPADAATVSQLSAEIGGIVPDYVKTEAESVIERVSAAQTGRTFTFAAITDLHYGNGGYTDGVLHACQALKHIDSRLKLDAVAVLGDYTDGYPASGLANAFADFRTINSVLNNLRFAPNLRMQGNHDYYADHAAEIRRHIQSYSEDVVWGDISGSYYYKDFEAYKLRVICLNTTETDNANIGCSNVQYQWFADSLDLSAKDDAEEWQILVLCHHPLDWYHSDESYALARIANAYQEGTSYSRTGVSCDFNGKNTAKLICNIHGHIHNLLVDNIHLGNVNNGVKSNVYRMATPEACINRANQYDGAWKEATSYPKTINTAEDTSFVIYCINLDTHTISAICYGAGYDRTLVYHTETVVYNITQTLTNVTSSNTAINIAQGEAFSATLTAQSGYELGTVKVTMGDEDVTASALSGSTITISSVTGDIVITATATLIPTGPAYTNQIPISVDTSGAVYNGTGYKDGYRLNSSGAEVALAGTAVTGYIPIQWNDVVRFKNINYYPGVNSTGNYIALYKPDFTNFNSDKDGLMTDSAMTYLYADRVKDDAGKLIQFRIADGSQDYGYMRVSAAGLNAESIITINEEITD